MESTAKTNQLIRENNQAAGKTWMWTYDSAGNILSKNEYAYTTGDLGTPVDTIPYTYNDADWGDLLTAYDGTAITYDTIGNPLNDGTWTYTWRNGRELESMSNGSATSTYTYDSNGMRVSRWSNGIPYMYVYNGGSLSQVIIQEWQILTFTYDANGIPMTVNYEGEDYSYITNLQGDVVGIADSTGALVVSYTYDAWGKPLSITGSMADTLGVQNPLRYRGYVYDTETGYYYLQSRYYDPEIGRFINADVFTTTGQGFLGNNMFAYCLNNPVNLKDPTGDIAITTLILIGSAIIGAAAAGYTAYKEYQAGYDTVRIVGDSICAGFAAFSIVYTGGMSLYQCYQNYCQLNAITPVECISSPSPAQTTVYRSVSAVEAKSIQETGKFSINQGGMESKQFGFVLSETKQFGNAVGQSIIVSARLPSSSLNQFCTIPVDTKIFKSGTLTVYSDQLDTFNRLIAGTIVMLK